MFFKLSNYDILGPLQLLFVLPLSYKSLKFSDAFIYIYNICFDAKIHCVRFPFASIIVFYIMAINKHNNAHVTTLRLVL